MAKMIISGAPVYFSHLDKSLMNAIIMQLEAEQNGDDATKGNIKFADHKLMFNHYSLIYVPVVLYQEIIHGFVCHSRQYFDPYHPSVPTPPPNLA